MSAPGKTPEGPLDTPESGGVADRWIPELYAQLRDLARQHVRPGDGGITLQPTAVVHEVYVRMARQDDEAWRSRTHFLAVAAQAMRQVLLNHHRDRNAIKRGGGRERITLSGCEPLLVPGELDLLALSDALEELARLDERQSRIVELRFFAGLTMSEIAEVLGVSTTTVENEWRYTRAWLKCALEGRSA